MTHANGRETRWNSFHSKFVNFGDIQMNIYTYTGTLSSVVQWFLFHIHISSSYYMCKKKFCMKTLSRTIVIWINDRFYNPLTPNLETLLGTSFSQIKSGHWYTKYNKRNYAKTIRGWAIYGCSASGEKSELRKCFNDGGFYCYYIYFLENKNW